MNREQFTDALLEAVYSKGIDLAEVYVQENETSEIHVYEEKIDKYEKAKTRGLSLRVFHEDQTGYAYTENFEADQIGFLIEQAIQNAGVLEREEVETIYRGEERAKQKEGKKSNIQAVPFEKKAEDLLSIESHIRKNHSHVNRILNLGYGEISKNVMIKNTEGLCLDFENTIGYRILRTDIKDGENIETKMDFDIFNDYHQNSVTKLADDNAKVLGRMVSPKGLKAGSYPVVLSKTAVNDLLGAFLSGFYAESVEKGISYFGDKLGQKVAWEGLQLVDDPFLKGALIQRDFDDEGVATKRKELIQDGMLKTFLHNRRTASKFGTKTTGNASRYSYKSPIAISHTNLMIAPGGHSLSDLLQEERVFYVRELAGLHAGLNVITGDFSLPAKGFLYEKGTEKHYVNQVTVAGNFYEMLNQIEGFSKDLWFYFPSALGAIATPAMKIKCLQVAGE